MKKINYTPQPIDTTDVVLPVELEELVEEMSKNVHEVWADTRIKQGWTYGEQRNDELKSILALCRTKTFLKRRRSMTAILPLVR